MVTNLQSKVLYATKWSSITEVIAKIAKPVSYMVLARIIAPEAFGVVAIVTMVVGLADLFSDAGFQKFLIQHEFKDDQEKYQNANVAFWTNMVISLFLWGIISIFSEPIASFVGNPGLGNVIIIACIQLPITSFSSIQLGLYKREFEYKILFNARLVSLCVPFGVTIPLAILGFNYWALIIGTLTGLFLTAVVLTAKSKWKPQKFYSFKILKEMFSFCMWTLIEILTVWFTAWIDVIIIANILNQYYVGIYSTSINMVNAFIDLIIATVTPVFFAALSRMQNDNTGLKQMFFKVQRYVSIVAFPLGVGIFLFSNFATQVFLGNQWNEASGVIGIWALASTISIVFGNFCAEFYRAKGKPKLSFLSQLLYLAVLVPVCLIYSKYGFWPFVYARSWILLELVAVHFILMKITMKINMFYTFKNVLPTAVSAAAMGVLGYLLQQMNTGIIWNIISIIICVLFYYGVLNLFPNMRKEVRVLAQKLKPGKLKSKSVVPQS